MALSLCARSRMVALLMMCLLTMAYSAELRASKTHMHALADEDDDAKAPGMLNKGEVHGIVGSGANGAEEDDDDADDDDEEDDNEGKDQTKADGNDLKKPAVPPRAWHNVAVAPASKAVSFYTKEEPVKKNLGLEGKHKAKGEAQAAKDGRVEKAHGALEAARGKKLAMSSKLEAFNDDDAFEDTMAAQVKRIANETDSPTLSTFLGALRREVRAFAKPTYPAYLESQVELEGKRVKELEAALAKEEGKNALEKSKTNKTIAKEDGGVKDENKSEGFSAAEVQQKAGETWAISFFATVVLLAGFFAMANTSTNALVKNYTLFVFDQVVLIFLAVMYFQAFDSLLSYADMKVHNLVLVSVVHAIGVLALIITFASFDKEGKMFLGILCGAGAHVASFSSIHAAASLQNYWVGLSHSLFMGLFGILVLGVGLAAVGYLVYSSKKQARLVDSGAFVDKTDDVENDFSAMAFSVVFTMFMRFLLTGHHPVDDETEFDHSAAQRGRMLIYACVCLLVAAFSCSFCTKQADKSDSYVVKRLMTFVNTVSVMNVAWAFLYWGEWEFFEAMYPGEAIKGRVMFAIVSTIVCGLGLIALTKAPPGKATSIKCDKMMALTALSLICAWGWELCFDAAVEDMSKGRAHPAGVKIATTILMFAVVLPVYAFHVRPITEPAVEAIA